jgi:hypothetical protein
MSGGHYNSAFRAGLIQDLVPIAIRAIGARPSHQMISIKPFLKGKIK